MLVFQKKISSPFIWKQDPLKLMLKINNNLYLGKWAVSSTTSGALQDFDFDEMTLHQDIQFDHEKIN